MKKHKVQYVVKKQRGNYQVVFRDGSCMFCPRECTGELDIGTTVYEHKHKNGKTVAFSWYNQLNFVVPQPIHFDSAVAFLENFKLFDRMAFGRAVVHNIGYHDGLLSCTEKIAHNMVLLGIKQSLARSR